MYFHNGNHIKTTQFHDHECLKEFVYVANLSSGEYLYSEHPYLLIQDNGVAITIDSALTTISHYDQNHDLIESYALEFITHCHDVSDDFVLSNHESATSYGVVSYASILVIVVVVVIVRRFL